MRCLNYHGFDHIAVQCTILFINQSEPKFTRPEIVKSEPPKPKTPMPGILDPETSTNLISITHSPPIVLPIGEPKIENLKDDPKKEIYIADPELAEAYQKYPCPE